MRAPRRHVIDRCATPGCSGNSRAAGLCKTCYDRKRRCGTWAEQMRLAQIAAAERKAHEAKLAAEDAAKADRAFARDARVRLFRKERSRLARKTARAMAEAKREFDAAMERQQLTGRGGRPRGQSILVGRDPANALVEALERSSR